MKLLSLSVALLLAGATASAQLVTRTTLDAPGDVGGHAAIVLGDDQRALISYYDATNGDLKVAHCSDAACTAATLSTLDSAGDVGRHTSIAKGLDGLGIVSYIDITNSTLKVAHCSNPACTSADISTIDTGADLEGLDTDITVGADGRAVIVFRRADGARAVRCVDVACSSGTGTSYPGFLRGFNPTITSTATMPLIAFDDGRTVFVGHCLDNGCTQATFIRAGFSLPDGPDGGLTPATALPAGADGAPPMDFFDYDASLARGVDGRGVLVYTHQRTIASSSDFWGYLRRCLDEACTALGPVVAWETSTFRIGSATLAIGANDIPSLLSTRSTDLTVSTCSTPSCAGVVRNLIDGPGAGRYSSIALDAAGVPLIAYYDSANQDLKVARFLGGTADLTVSLQDTPDPVAPNQTLRYTLSAQNLGPDVGRGVVTTLALPVGVTYLSGSATCAYDNPSHTVTCPSADIAPGGFSSAASVDVVAPPGLSGPLSATASVASTTNDLNPANNSAATTTATTPAFRVTSPVVIEGNAGLRQVQFEVAYLSDGSAPAPSLSLNYATGGGSAQPGSDYLSVSGALSFSPAAPTQIVFTSVVGDISVESNENFFLQLSNPQGAVVVPDLQGAVIVDDDVTLPVAGELAHGMSIEADLRTGAGPIPPQHLYRVVVPPQASFEVVVDGLSGDVLPLSLERMNASGAVLQVSVPSGTGAARSLRWANTTAFPVASELVSVRSGGCSSTCGADDVYRVRTYETTVRIPRFNNTTQATILILQNTSALPFVSEAYFWDVAGHELARVQISLPARGVSVTNTASLVPGQNGSITVSHGGPYGTLRGKAVAIEPATGFTFDSPLEYRPR